MAQVATEESFSALSTELLSRGFLTRPLDLTTLFLSPSLPSSSSTSSKSLKKHQDTLILQSRAREQLAKCLWGMLEKNAGEREALEGVMAREARAQMEGERERGMRERAEREGEQAKRELEMEREKRKDAEAKLKTEQERHRHAKDELSKMKSALQFVKTQALHDQKRREAEVTSLHTRLQKATTTTDSAFSRFVVLNQPSSSSSSSSSPLSVTFGGRTSRLSSTSRAPTPTSPVAAADAAARHALQAELDLVQSALDEASSSRQHLQEENTGLREFVGEVGEWTEAVMELEEFKAAVAGEAGRELEEVLGEGGDGDESYLIPTPRRSLPVSSLVTPLHRKLYAIRLGLSSLSTSATSRLTELHGELQSEIDDLQAKLSGVEQEKEEQRREVEEAEKRAEEADRLVREFAERQAEGRRKTMAREAESDDEALPAGAVAAKTSRLASKALKQPTSAKLPPPVPSLPAGPRPSEPPSSAVSHFLSELGLDTPAAPNEALVSKAVKEKTQEKERRETRFDGVAGSVERQREKKNIEGLVRPTGTKVAGTRRPSASALSRDKPSPASSATSSSTSSSALASILALADSPPVSSAPLVSTAAAAKKPLSTSSAVNTAVPARTGTSRQEDKEKVKAKKAALLERARAATAASRA